MTSTRCGPSQNQGGQLEKKGDRVSGPFMVVEESLQIAARLKTSLSGDGPLSGGRVLVFANARDRESVGTVAAQIAIATVKLGQRPVLLVDANRIRPSLGSVFKIREDPGLGEILAGTAMVKEAVRFSCLRGFALLPAGRADATLGTPWRTVALIERARKRFKLVVVISPPVLDSAAASVLASQSDGVVLVIAENRRSKSEIAEVKEILDGVKAKIIGAVLSQTKGREVPLVVTERAARKMEKL